MDLRSQPKDAKGLPLFPVSSENVPVFGGYWLRRMGIWLVRVTGWRMVGEIPDEKKLVLAAAPHTSNWDFILAMLFVMATGIRISYLMKKEAFVWPFGKLFMALGGIPLNRKAADDTVDQIAQWYSEHDKVWVVITPEGTRGKVERWKTGFLRLAERADVPVYLVAWDYPTKTIHIGKKWPRSGDHVKDAEGIRDYLCSRYTGRHPENQ
ncbi:1-acyl-sn-glycerol-3-phosphate acyltransferase [Teredinibacter waterburyi]|jgi:1-acyl-sn-glycerol-3-phosphate acyltransferase|uniref:1-acyl-sn-glycerol-3-phosphate acyltransferase n=1 Tax=Teredinibacter waterburyi TaxID=1500538 RepID=UPI00165FFB0E|nr:1-acyl-sn-glycerol-3-phosphate acyltransferase [Teredinibacter waterburyi]